MYQALFDITVNFDRFCSRKQVILFIYLQLRIERPTKNLTRGFWETRRPALDGTVPIYYDLFRFFENINTQAACNPRLTRSKLGVF